MNNLNSAVYTHLLIVFVITTVIATCLHMKLKLNIKRGAVYANLLASKDLVTVCMVLHSNVYLYYHPPTKQYLDTATNNRRARNYIQSMRHYTKLIYKTSNVNDKKTYEILKQQVFKHNDWINNKSKLIEEFGKRICK